MLPGGGTTPAAREVAWHLDTLGNWNGQTLTGGSPLHGRVVAGDTSVPPNGVADDTTVTRTDTTDSRNRILSQQNSGSASINFVYDRVGNLVSDGVFFYQYDAFNRLVQINREDGGSMAYDPATGEPTMGSTAGPWVAHYTYDGLGRLIRKQVPWNRGRTAVRAEHYYYDGVRRVQEVYTDPKPGTFPPTIEKGEPLPNPVYIDRTEREYVWSPGGSGGGYVDELVCQITTANVPQYTLQDGNYNVAALVSTTGDVLCQVSYDPYGEPVIAEHLASHADLRVGHQGLFLDRLDLLGDGTLDVTSSPPGPHYTLATPTGGLGGKALYQNRNRTYSPGLGRFLQRDPKFSDQQVLPAWSIHGASPDLVHLTSNLVQMYLDGMSLSQYVGSNPVNGIDPTGLFDFSLGGFSWTSAVSAGLWQGAIGGVIGAISGGIGNAVEGGDVEQGAIAGFVGGFITGALSGGFASGFASAGSGALWGMTIGAGGAGGLAEGVINGDTGLDLFLDFVLGGAGAGVGKGLGGHLGSTEIAQEAWEQFLVPSAWAYQGIFRKVWGLKRQRP